MIRKLHYFDQEKADPDMKLEMAVGQGYVPKTCLLGGSAVMFEVEGGRDPCTGCEGPRAKCLGRSKS